MKRLFIHGWHSKPRGAKLTLFATATKSLTQSYLTTILRKLSTSPK